MQKKNHASRRERERNELKLRIVNAASTLFMQGGEEAVTLRQVAEMIEYSATAIYAHFPNKESLVREVCRMELARFAQSLTLAGHLPDPMTRLRKTASIYVDFGLQCPEQYRVLLMRAPSRRPAATPSRKPEVDPGTATPAEPREQPYDYLQSAVFKAMAAGCFKPEYRDVALIAQTIWSTLHGIVALHLVRAQQDRVPWKPVQHVLELSLESLFNGLVVSSAQTPPTWWRG